MNLIARATQAASRASNVRKIFGVALAALSLSMAMTTSASAAKQEKVRVVAAENFYGDVVRQVGGTHVDVTSILSNPDQDPHLFEASPKTARALQHAAIVVYNGAAYDPWMDKLLAASKSTQQTRIVAAELTGKKAGDNPHLWYAPSTMPKVARAIADALALADPPHKADFEKNLAAFLDAMKPIDTKVADLHRHYAHVPVSATEPVFGYMSDAIGLDMRNERFQLAAMNDTEPSATDIATFEDDLRTRKIRVLVYNRQASNQLTRRLLELAHRAGVPTVSVTETQPAGWTYQQWMLAQLDALSAALKGKQP